MMSLRDARFWLCLAAAVLTCWLGIQIATRVAFPWDLLVWSESPFMTNMLKLTAGEPLFGDPADANSFVYSPGLDYLTYAVLRPFGAQLDIRAARFVSVVIGVAAAWFATQAGLALARSDRPSLTTKLALTALAMLLVFRNLTADVPHPDNLHMLHLALTLYLAYRAQRHFDDAEQARGMRWAVAAMVLAALGILAKQTAAGTAIGLWGAWLWTGSLSRGRLVKLAAIAIAIAGLSAAWLLVPTWSRFHCFELLAAHPVEVRARLQQLLIDLHVHSHFAGPPILALAAVLVNRRLRWLPWLGVGATSALTGFGGYVKAMGVFNNLGVVLLWCFIGAVPLLARAFEAAKEDRPRHWSQLAVAWLMLSCLPSRVAPNRDIVKHCEAFQAAVTADLAAGKRVLIAHGAMFAIRAGDRSVPRDRANSVLELNVGKAGDRQETAARLKATHYDVIYLNSPWYGGEVASAITGRYRYRATIPAAVEPAGYFGSVQPLTPETRILERRPPPSTVVPLSR